MTSGTAQGSRRGASKQPEAAVKFSYHQCLHKCAELEPSCTTDYQLVENSGQRVMLHKPLPKPQEQAWCVLIFSQMTHVVDILKD